MDFMTLVAGGAPEWPAWATALFIALLVWSVIWKGLALWRAAHREEKLWFAIFLLVNTIGVLEIIYLFFIAKDKKLRRLVGLERRE